MPLLEARGIGKSFGPFRALEGIDLRLERGEMLGLVGANGAGKSTLVKIICGVFPQDDGIVVVDGSESALHDVAGAIAAGIAVAHQQIATIPILSAAENIMLGREPRTRGFIDRRKLFAHAEAIAARAGISLDLSGECGDMSLGENKIVDILKALAADPIILILDEPTASLTLAESRRLFAFLEGLKARGLGIILISHHMNEVFDHCDSFVVLKDGVKVHDGPTAGLTREEVVRLMVGRAIEAADWASHAVPGEAVVKLTDLRIGKLRIPNMEVHRGEVVGIAGVLGAGQTQLLETLAGARVVSSEHHAARSTGVALNGLDYLPRSVAEANDAGIFIVADERQRKALFPGLTVGENLMTGTLEANGRYGFMEARRETELAEGLIRDLRIKCEGAAQDIGQLSGGNQQKVAFGRWIARMRRTSRKAPLFLLDNPTEGVDVGAKAELYALIRGFAQDGASVLITSAEFGELLALCDRIYVVRNGEVTRDIKRGACGEEQLLLEVS
jgi:ribose transport system ATP-binding protein